MKRTVLRTVCVAGALALGVGLAGCANGGSGDGSGDQAAEDIMVGVAMPTETSERWIADGDAVESQLEEAGYVSSVKAFVGRRPKSTYQLTPRGRQAFDDYLSSLRRIIDAVERARNEDPDTTLP